ncbi:DUF4352 domain-containing protein [Haloferax mediterranei ATCC 33500]|uniref:DUF4352 domain-containing protein n=1 Tax=Haloferax mediterranei (strain ATCC 33500 / DSM 1411 / JCM 8866 / NBRC 14739 / NCIMB 2177 / R-4) TaxID=523841 RepID=I3R253_HALMT|nr:DUF4352 domain-containing protein [Haloferax mediterranei]AFK18313.1 hypothetical protein HFX_0588 [Haloferax mediterranei ATCC 33500]AHZ22289.1 hypothetical protein BM92_06320 [Haloferax mediterranei ATCC 33500]EMA02416.1 hypothetical protein C439_07535 [Haloferax mediterranei ATCC 33500]MDX5988401.1 DUF4352 domain-containing protein [Haloferax mediterranei ATCC 33500]QCQ74828.1 DUF4352 domain-containing protein [Haloferax mediterranei ATCC 33500]
MNRRTYLGLVGTTVGLSGCTGGGDQPRTDTDTTEPRTQGPTPQTAVETTVDNVSEGSGEYGLDVAEATVGEVFGDETLAMVIRSIERVSQIGAFKRADDGKVFLKVRLAVKNVTSDEYLAFSGKSQTRVVDAEKQAYQQTQTFDQSGKQFTAGQLVPGEVSRGDLAYEIPEDASDLKLRFDFLASDPFSYDRVVVPLGDSPNSPEDVIQDFQVDVASPGEAIEFNGISVTVNSVDIAGNVGSSNAGDGKEYAIVDFSVENKTDEQQQLSSLLQMCLKDGAGFPYSQDIVATSQLSEPYEDNYIDSGDTQRGKLAYNVAEGAAPLYWTLDFDLMADADKGIWNVR